MNNKYLYLVEGKDELALVKALKENPALIRQGRVSLFDPTKSKLTPNRMINISPGTVVVLVFDTDTNSSDVLEFNIKMLKKYVSRVSIVLVPQVLNIEDELERATNVRKAQELTNSKSLSNFKSDFAGSSNVRALLIKHRFDIDKLWVLLPSGAFGQYKQESDKIKIDRA